MKKQRWVIKAGSQMVCEGGPLLLRAWAKQINFLLKNNIEVIWITSGAIATAKEKLNIEKKTEFQIFEKQALSAIGQPIIMELYNIAFSAEKLQTAQILLTYDDLKNLKRKKNFKNAIETLLKWKTVPIINENDAVATEEIKFGDNDSLSAQVAHHTKADKLIILTDVDGLYDKNPKDHANAKRIMLLNKIPPALLKNKSLKGKSNRGTGGMLTKLMAAQHALKNNIETHLVKGDQDQVLIQIFNKKSPGTIIK